MVEAAEFAHGFTTPRRDEVDRELRNLSSSWLYGPRRSCHIRARISGREQWFGLHFLAAEPGGDGVPFQSAGKGERRVKRPIEVLRDAVSAVRERVSAKSANPSAPYARHHAAGVGGFGGGRLRSHPVLLGRRAFLSGLRPGGLLAQLGHEGWSTLLQRLRMFALASVCGPIRGRPTRYSGRPTSAVGSYYPAAAMLPQMIFGLPGCMAARPAAGIVRLSACADDRGLYSRSVGGSGRTWSGTGGGFRSVRRSGHSGVDGSRSGQLGGVVSAGRSGFSGGVVPTAVGSRHDHGGAGNADKTTVRCAGCSVVRGPAMADGRRRGRRRGDRPVLPRIYCGRATFRPQSHNRSTSTLSYGSLPMAFGFRNVSFGRALLLIPDGVKVYQTGGKIPDGFLAGPRSLAGYAVLVIIVISVLALGRRIPPVMTGIMLLASASLFPAVVFHYYLVFVLPVAALIVRNPDGPLGAGIFDQLATHGGRRRAVGICVSLAVALSIAQVAVPGRPVAEPVLGQILGQPGVIGVVGTRPLVVSTVFLVPILWLIACAVIIVSYARRPASCDRTDRGQAQENPPDSAVSTSSCMSEPESSHKGGVIWRNFRWEGPRAPSPPRAADR